MPDDDKKPVSAKPKPKPKPRPVIVGPAALIAPVMSGGEEANALVLFPQYLEFLAIRVMFHRVPVPGLTVRFFTNAGAAVEGELLTNEHGIAKTRSRVPAGTYRCEIEHQESTGVSSVKELAAPYPVPLPVGRPYLDLHERLEF